MANVRGRPLAVILRASWNGLSFARSLGRRGIPVLLLESERFLGTYTRFGKVVILPPVDEDPHAWMRTLQFVGDRLPDRGVLMPMGDADTLLVSERASQLRPRFRFVVPPPETAVQIVDKRLQYAGARRAGVTVPGVHFPGSLEDVRRLSAEVPLPCLLKPYRSHIGVKATGRKVAVVRSAGELIASYERLSALGVPVMVQEIIPGDDRALFGYLAFWDGEGREVAWLTKRKLRQNPPCFGDGSLQITVDAPEVAALSRRLLRAFDYRGFVGVEFKLDAADGTHYLMEVNPRTVSGNQLAMSAGVDFPWIGYRYLTGLAPGNESTPTFRRRVKYMNEELDVLAYAALRRSDGMTFGQWVRSIRGTRSTAIWARDDPMPLVVGGWRFVRFLLSPSPGPRSALRRLTAAHRSAWSLAGGWLRARVGWRRGRPGERHHRLDGGGCERLD